MRLLGRVFILVVTSVLLAQVPVSQAAMPQVERHDLQCGDVFPCPEEIQRRVDFWVQVFRQWGTGQRVIHDSERPEKVFSVLTTEDQCSARRPGRLVKQEQDRIRDGLRSLAGRVESGQSPENSFQRDLANLYPGASGQELRSAAGRLRCQSGNRDRFAEALQRFGEYRPFVVEYLSDAGLSTELQYLPFVESAYHPKAYSHLGAAGIWQIMPKTARTLGLQISASVDERFDPRLATQGAIRYFQNSVKQLTRTASAQGSRVTPGRLNPFVVTSYNYGVRGMTRAVEQVGLDYVRLLDEYKSRTFRTAVKNFYASFLAARYVAKNANQYFNGIQGNAVPKTSVVSIPNSASAKRLLSVFNVSETALKDLNPSLTSRVWKGFSYVPAGFNLALPSRSDGWSAQRTELAALPYEGASDGGERHLVERGDTACQVADLYRVKCRDVIELNQLGRRATIYIGQVLAIPGKGGATMAAASVLPGGRHVVRGGQTPCGIANQYRANCQSFLNANGLSMRSKIYVGQTLLVPGMPGDSLFAGSHTVRSGQSPCSIARDYGVKCDSILSANGLNRRSIIYVGQTLTVPGSDSSTVQVAAVADSTKNPSSVESPVPVTVTTTVSSSDSGSSNDSGWEIRPADAGGTITAAVTSSSASVDSIESSPLSTAEQPARLQATADERLAPLYDWQDLAVDRVGDRYQIDVLPEENLGYYADWLGIGPAGELRRMNNLRFGDVLEVGEQLRLPITHEGQLALFESRRKEFHSLLVDEYVQRFDVNDVQSYRIQSGDTLWDISNDFDVPMWVLYRFNQGALLATVGAEIAVPEVSDRK
ncbi:MAG: LysM peptidoglycan-binding domain-containing protein [Proteobacteria bacterium]|jgi:membrane-bound lytic murein transglycosylase D|nr:LysM peptidoglycan-binding domain-containing protein [Pseudomonadota bacterium]